MLRSVFLICLITILMSFINLPHTAHADNNESDTTWTTLTDISNNIFLYTEDGKLQEAKTMIDLFAKKWAEAVPNKIKVKDKDLTVVHATYEQLDRVFKDNLDNQDALLDAATEFRLVIDALSTNENPLWTHMDKKILNQFTMMEKTAQKGDNEAFQSQLNTFLDDYKLIYPALVIDLNPRRLAQIDGDVQFLTKARMNIVQNKSKLTHLNQIFSDFNSLFGQSKTNNSPRLLWTSLAIAGIIIFTLIYVSWKKYIGEYRFKAFKF